MQVVSQLSSKDGITTKYVQEVGDGQYIETVAVRRPEKTIVCFSSQVGCPMGCTICSSGPIPFIRNLSDQEIVEQCLNVIPGDGSPLLFSAMGIGEPLANASLFPALSELGNLGKIAISTIGLHLQKLIKFGYEFPNAKIQLSVHSTDDGLRRSLLDPRLPALSITLETLALVPNPLEFNYTLLRGINDSPQDAKALGVFFRSADGKIKINKYNKIHGAEYEPSDPKNTKTFINILQQSGLKVEYYETDGSDIGAACGQLSLRSSR